MAFEYKNLVQLSAGETSPDQLGGQKLMSYESENDLVATMATAGYFNDIAKLVRFGSLFILTDNFPLSDVFQVTSNNPDADVVILAPYAMPVPASGVYYETLAEVAATFVTAGGLSDVYPMADSVMGAYANFSLNSPVNDIGPPIAHSGIEHIECQAGQVEIFWSRPVIPGQTVNLWLQIRSGTPTP